MNQVVDNYWTGKVTLEQVCAPTLRKGSLLVRTAFSLISAGTERMKVQQAKMNLVEKARARPDQVARVMEAITRHGVVATYQKVTNRLKTPVPLGYSLAGTVVAVGDGVNDFQVGDRVAGAGSSANHAEYNLIPVNLCCRVPDDVPLDRAACTTVGAIALQGVRQANPQLGDLVVVIGLGLVGQFCIQLLAASGCKVLGLDLESSRLELAKTLGAHFVGLPEETSARRQVQAISDGIGADIVVVAASSSTADPVHLAAELARDRARIVDIGKTKLDLPWEIFYEKELDLRMSRSYGPGRYDPSYEEKGVDYPVGYVRWTEKHNMELFLELVAQGKVRTQEIINRRFTIADAETAYQKLLEDKSAMGILLEYPADAVVPASRLDFAAPGLPSPGFPAPRTQPGEIVLGVIGAGNHCKSMLLPGLRRESQVVKKGICAATGLSVTDTAKRFQFQYATTDAEQIVNDPTINTVFIATRHNLHAPLALAALKNGKAVFVEKPLAIKEEELSSLESMARERKCALMVGYNRRFAPHVRQLARWMHTQPEPWIATYRVNAGSLPLNHWYYDPEQGGGRLLGEVCHFVDLLVFLFGSYPDAVQTAIASVGRSRPVEDNAVSTLHFDSGSLGQIIYSAEGDPTIPKERLEVIGNGSVATLDNFQRLSIVQNHKKRTWRSIVPDKGHQACLQSFLQAVYTGAEMPIALNDLFRVSHVCFQLTHSLQQQTSIPRPVVG
jgi:predicted dehydrogenase/threonine dehydrogenase-like Zn-dependent dehydrogenase